MPTSIGQLAVEVTEPESPRFTASLLLVHGLWERAAAWRRFAGYLAHRGWRCVAVDLGGDGDLAARAAALRGTIAALGAPPVLLGHDLGATLALQSAEMARAVVALTPLLGPPHAEPAPPLYAAGTWLARRRGTPLRAPRGRWHALYPTDDLCEPALLVRAVAGGALRLTPVPATVPAIVFAAERDPLLDPRQARAVADLVGAELSVLGGVGHAVLDEPGWESGVAAIHRWIVQRLGVDLLALYDEAWEGREKPEP